MHNRFTVSLIRGLVLIGLLTLAALLAGCPSAGAGGGGGGGGETVPAAPTSLTAVASGGNVQLTWTDNSTNETGFIVSRSDDGGSSFTQLTTTAADATSYTDSTAVDSGTYTFRVAATNSAGTSTAAEFTYSGAGGPAAPTNLSTTIVSGFVQLSWTDNSDDETGFIVSRSDDGGTVFSQLTTTGANVTTTIDATSTESGTYTYRVAATNADGTSAPAEVVYSGSIDPGFSRIVGSIVAPGAPAGTIQNAEVFVVGQTGRTVLTDSFGNFSLDIANNVVGSIVASNVAPDGTFQLVVRSGDEQYGIKQDGISVTDQQITTLDSDLTVEQVGSISGQFTLEGAGDSSGTLVYVPGTSYTAVTDASGNFTISNVPPGTYNYVRADADGYLSGLVPGVAVSSNADTTLDSQELAVSLGGSGTITINGGDAYATSRTVTLTIDAPDGAIRMRVSEDDAFTGVAFELISSEREYTFDSDGTKEVFIEWLDADSVPVSDSDTIIVDTSPSVSLVSPTADATLSDTTPTLDWTDGPALPGGIRYLVQVATDSGFTSVVDEVVDSDNLTDSAYTVSTPLAEGTYYWRVAIDQIANQAWDFTGGRTFSVDIGTLTPNTPDQSDTTPALTWTESSPISGQAGRTYEVQLDNDNDFSSPIVDLTGLDALVGGTANYQVPTTLADQTTYYLRARLIDEDGIVGEWSSLSYATNIGSVTPSSPSSGFLTADRTPTFMWNENPVADTYVLEISTNSDLTSPELTKSALAGTSETYTLDAGEELVAASGTTYYWAVTPVDENGVAGTRSTIETFEVDTTAPVISSILLDAEETGNTGNTYTFDSGVALVMSVSDEQPDGDLTLEWDFDDGSEPFANSTTYSDRTVLTLPAHVESLTADDTKTIYVRVYDPVANSSSATETIILDPNVYVDSTNGSDAPGTTGHKDEPFATLSAALAVAESYTPNQLRLAQDTYSVGSSGLWISSSVGLVGGYATDFATRSTDETLTTISGTGEYTVKYTSSGTGSTTHVRDLTITNSGSSIDPGMVVGLFLSFAEPSVTNIAVEMTGEDNVGTDAYTDPDTGREIFDTAAVAGIFVHDASPTIDSVAVTFDTPDSGTHGSNPGTRAVGAAGLVILGSDSTATIENSTINGGVGAVTSTGLLEFNAGSAGIALFPEGSGSYLVRNNTIAGGTGSTTSGGSAGSAGILAVANDYIIENNVSITGGTGTATGTPGGSRAASAGIRMVSGGGGTRIVRENTLIAGGTGNTSLSPVVEDTSVGSAGIHSEASLAQITGNIEVRGGVGYTSGVRSPASAGIFVYREDDQIIEDNVFIGGAGVASSTADNSPGSVGYYQAASSGTRAINNYIKATGGSDAGNNSFDSVGAFLDDPVLFVNNTVLVEATTSTDEAAVIGLESGASSASVLNTLLVATYGDTSGTVYGMFEFNSSGEPAAVENNLLVGNSGAGFTEIPYYDASDSGSEDKTTQTDWNAINSTFLNNIYASGPEEDVADIVDVTTSSAAAPLASGSSAIDAGKDVSSSTFGSVTTDFEGDGRSTGEGGDGSWDIGYDEF